MGEDADGGPRRSLKVNREIRIEVGISGVSVSRNRRFRRVAMLETGSAGGCGCSGGELSWAGRTEMVVDTVSTSPPSTLPTSQTVRERQGACGQGSPDKPNPTTSHDNAQLHTAHRHCERFNQEWDVQGVRPYGVVGALVSHSGGLDL